MKIVIQRVQEASVRVEGKSVGRIGKGLLVLLGVHKDDTPDKTGKLAQKLVNLRVFQDTDGRMNHSLKDIGGAVLIISQFTLYGDCGQGRRPEFTAAAAGPVAKPIYEKFVGELKKELAIVETGVFGAYMEVSLVNDGPVTLIIES